MKCPHCGAPPPAGFVVPPGQFSYRCVYCNQSSTQGTAVSQAPQAPVTGPIFIVHHYGHHDDEDDDDDDYVPHQHHYVAPVVTRHGMPWLVWVIVVVIVSLGGTGAGFMRCTKHSTLASSFVWNGSEPLVCSGNEQISVSGVTASFNAGSAIHANGNCQVRCTDCNLSAPTVIEAGGNANVTIINGTIKGSPLLADASANSRVTITGNVTASGSTKQSGNAKVSAPAAAPSAQPAQPVAARAPTPAAAPAPTPAPPTAKSAPKSKKR